MTDVAKRDSHADDEFRMTVGRGTFSGKGGREEAAKALNDVVICWANEQSPQVRGSYRGFDIISQGHAFGKEHDPDLYVRGALTYRAQLNAANPVGTMQSIEYALRSLDRRADDEMQYSKQQEQALAEYKAQLGRPFEHENRLKELLLKQAELNALLDLDKGDRQAVSEATEETGKQVPASFAAKILSERHPSEMSH